MATIGLLEVLRFILSLVSPLPLKDDRGQHRSFPFMTVGLVALNIVAFVFAFYALPGLVGGEEVWQELMIHLLLVPTDILSGRGLGAVSIITAAFLHAGWLHLLGNMLILFFFGRKLEDVLGPVKFGLFYLLAVFVAGIGSVVGWAALPVTQGEIYSVGASGAIMGVLGAYLFMYSEQRIHTLLLPLPIIVRVPVWAYMLYNVGHDILGGLLEQQAQALGQTSTGVDVFAHLGGLIAGLMCIFLFLPAEILHYRHQGSRAVRSAPPESFT